MNNLTLQSKRTKVAKVNEDNLSGSSYISVSITSGMSDWAEAVFVNTKNHISKVFFSDATDDESAQTVQKTKVDKSKLDSDPEKVPEVTGTVIAKGNNNILVAGTVLILLLLCGIIPFVISRRKAK